MDMRRKYFLGVLTILVLAGVGYSGWRWYERKTAFDPSVDPREFTSAGEVQDYYKNLAELYKKDTYGGKTPEETLQLFIDALKKGDTDLAAKYFIPEKQKKEAEDLKLGMKSGGIQRLIEYYSINNKEINKLYEDRERVIFKNKDGGPGFIFEMSLNKTNNIWKITDL